MKKFAKIRLLLSRNWNFPLKERLTKYLVPRGDDKQYSTGITLNTRGTLFNFDTRNYIEYKIFAEGYYEKEVTLLMQNYIEPGDLVIDVGANIGVHSLTLSKMVGNSGKVFSFEPIPFLREKLEQNRILNRCNNISIQPFALSDANYTIKTAFSENVNNGTFFIENNPKGKIEIDCVKGDDWVEEHQLDSLKLIKIDVEGFEYKVLTGLKITIQKFKPVLFFEYDPSYINRAGSNPQDFNHIFFIELNYNLYTIDKCVLTPFTDFNQFSGMVIVLGLPA